MNTTKMSRYLLNSLKSVIRHRTYYTINSNLIKKNTEMKELLSKQLRSRIKLSGPITVAEYMREVLTNPLTGYYMHKDVIGNDGDFITSPELGQIFGEMVALWFLNEWKKIGSPKPLQIVELGPGRGSLCQDILRVFKHFNELSTDVSIHLVEMSPVLCDIQARKLCLKSQSVKNAQYYHEGQTAAGNSVFWYQSLDDVPREFSIYVAHEFFDALPIHKFQKTDKGFREILIDIDETNETKFKYVLSNTETIASKLFISSTEKRNHLEISKDTVTIVKNLATRLEEDGGICLIADYGYDLPAYNTDKTDTFRAFKNHKLHDPLISPGSADLTADVDFHLIRTVAQAENKTIAFGPMQQRIFLQQMGIELRLEQLLKHTTPEQEKSLKFTVEMMTSEQQMGKRFLFMSLFPQVLEKHLTKFPVVGFIKE